MKVLRVAVLLINVGLLAACGRPDASRWTGLGGDLSNTFNNRDERKLTTKNASRLAPIWETSRFTSVNGAPVIVKGVVYVQTHGGTYALSAANGETIWANEAISGSSTPAYDEGELFVHDAASWLYALDAKDGHELWRVHTDEQPGTAGWSSPVVMDGYVIVGMSSGLEAVDNDSTSAYRGGVVAFNRSTGKEIWRTYTVDPPYNGATVWSTVSIDPELGLVYATTGNNYTGEASDTSDSIFALRLSDGKIAWLTQLSKGDVFTIIHQLSPDSDFGTNPILFEARINGVKRKLVGAGQKSGVFWALDRRTGSVVWSQTISAGSALGGGMLNNGAFDGQHILVAGDRATSDAPGGEPANGESVNIFPPNTSVLKALNPSTGEVVWERQLPAWVWAPITVANGVGFVAYETQLQAFDVNTGAKLFNYKTGGTISSAPVIVDGAVYFGSGITYIGTHPDHTLHALAVDGVRVGGDFPDAGTDAGPVADAGTDAASVPSFSKIYQELIVGSGCASSFCHGGSAGNLTMTTQDEAYQALVGVPAAGPSCASAGTKRVDPGHPESSLLLDKIANAAPACGTVMPPGASVTVAPEIVEDVRAWIAAGAPQN